MEFEKSNFTIIFNTIDDMYKDKFRVLDQMQKEGYDQDELYNEICSFRHLCYAIVEGASLVKGIDDLETKALRKAIRDNSDILEMDFIDEEPLDEEEEIK